MPIGFIGNTSVVSAIGNSYDVSKVVTLSSSSIFTGSSLPGPQVLASHLEVTLTSAASVTGVEFCVCWDVTGDYAAIGPTKSAIVPFNGLTTANSRVFTAYLNKQVIDFANGYPGAADAQKRLYMFLKLTGGTGTLAESKLYWYT